MFVSMMTAGFLTLGIRLVFEEPMSVASTSPCSQGNLLQMQLKMQKDAAPSQTLLPSPRGGELGIRDVLAHPLATATVHSEHASAGPARRQQRTCQGLCAMLASRVLSSEREPGVYTGSADRGAKSCRFRSHLRCGGTMILSPKTLSARCAMASVTPWADQIRGGLLIRSMLISTKRGVGVDHAVSSLEQTWAGSSTSTEFGGFDRIWGGFYQICVGFAVVS